MFLETTELSPENLMNSKVLSTQECCISVKFCNSLQLGQFLLYAQSLSGFLYEHFHSPALVVFSWVHRYVDDIVNCAFKPHFAFSKMEYSFTDRMKSSKYYY